MTGAFGFLVVGWLMLASAVRNQGMADTLRGAVSSGDAGPGARGFATAILGPPPPAGVSGPAGASGHVPSGMQQVDGHPVCAWIAQELQRARRNGWRGQVVSGYRNRQEQAAACAHTSGPCAKPGESNHQGTSFPSCAVDVTDPAGLARALGGGSRLHWTGRTIGDSPHFSSGRRGV